MSWIDDLMIITPKTEGLMEEEKDAFKERFDCDDNGEIREYVGCKIELVDGGIKMTHPVVIQSLEDEFDIPSGGKIPTTPAPAREVLAEGDERLLLEPREQKIYQSRIGKLMYLARWTRPDILFAVRSLAKFNGKAAPVHMNAMYRIMKYVLHTKDYGLFIKPEKWTTEVTKKFVVTGYSDSDYANDLDDRISVTGGAVFVNGAPVSEISRRQQTVATSVTEAEGAAAIEVAKDMLQAMHTLESIGMEVQKPMILFVDNKGAYDQANSWKIGGRTRHVAVKEHFLRELKERNLILIQWIPGDQNPVDIFTKNLSEKGIKKHSGAFMHTTGPPKGENVGGGLVSPVEHTANTK